MNPCNKPLWIEGTLLTQQHLQSWECYLLSLLQGYHQHQHPLGWGLIKLIVDQNKVENNYLSIVSCQAIFPNGRWVSHSKDEDGELGIHMNISQEKTTLYLCLSRGEQAGGIPNYPKPTRHPAWRGFYQKVIDNHDPNRESELLLARPNLYLSAKAPPNTWHIPILRLQPATPWEIDKDFIPPILNTQPHPHLRRRLLALSKTLYSTSQHKDRQLALVLGAALPQLTDPHLHPHEIYLTLCRLFAQLSLLTANEYVQPTYQHSNLEDTFTQLLSRIELCLTGLRHRTNVINLEREQDNIFYHLDLPKSFLTAANPFITLKLSKLENPSRQLRHIKISSYDSIRVLVDAALPGLAFSITHEGSRFILKPDRQHPLWEDMTLKGSIGVFVPPILTVQEIKLTF